MTVVYYCGDEGRLAEVRKSTLNGIDFLEVSPDQLKLSVHFLKPAPPGITKEKVVIEGGVRITNVRVESVEYAGDVVEVTVNIPGDFSVYTLRLQDVTGMDPRLSAVKFSFKVDCQSNFDCKPPAFCPPQQLIEPDIDYLAKDYASLRQLILDRLSTIMPDWKERSPADMGIALIELMAYVGDMLSYYQDAVATEAYLGTARKRISVRRHARLVDYYMHEGCNARAWVQFEVGINVTLPKVTPIILRKPNQPVVVPLDKAVRVLTEESVVFETMHDAELYPGYHELNFYTWSDRECCLPKGATEATLIGPKPNLKVGDVLIFEEVLGPKTGEKADNDPAHRHVVRLTNVTHSVDPLNNQEIVEIVWEKADALPFPLCISSQTAEEHGSRYIDKVSVARGNVVLADHGQWLRNPDDKILEEEIGEVPKDSPFRPVLQRGPLTHAVPLPDDFLNQPAANISNYEPKEARPSIFLKVPAVGERWEPQRDLLRSDKFATEFVVEMDENGLAHLRFGDDIHGKRPSAKTVFTASYRIGNGAAGNIGVDALGRVITNETGIISLRNPLPASGGRDPELLEEVIQFAPQAFRVQQRAVTEDDYARVAERHPEVQRAAATFRWTGSWHTVFVSVDRRGSLPVDAAFERRIREHLNFYRMAGHDLEIDGPCFVPLDIAITVCVKPDHFRSDVKVSLLEKFSNRLLPDGSRGFFHPDNWTFSQPVYLSLIYSTAHTVAGVESVEVTRFQRWGRGPNFELENYVLPIGRLEIARLDNDPNFQENGRIEFNLVGGK